MKNNWKSQFITITIGQTISLVGSSAVQFALIWWLSKETASAVVLALSGLVAFLPQAILGPFAGVWIDRLKRKNVVIAADLFSGVVAVLFALWFLIGSPPYWSVILILGIRAIGNVFHTPAIQALIPSFVPAEALMRVGGVQQFLQSGAFMLGPVIGALLFEIVSMPIILLSDLIGAIFACLTLAFVKIEETPREHTQKQVFISELKHGFKALCADKKLLILILSVTICGMFYLPLSSYYPLMTSSFFSLSSFYGSFVEFMFALGMLLVSGLVGLIGHTKKQILLAHMGMLGMGIASLFCGLVSKTLGGYWVFAALCLIMGGCANLYGVPTVAYMQENIEPASQGRVFSLIGSLMSLSMPVGLLFSGPIAETYGVRFWFLVSGIAMTIITLFALFITKLNENSIQK